MGNLLVRGDIEDEVLGRTPSRVRHREIYLLGRTRVAGSARASTPISSRLSSQLEAGPSFLSRSWSSSSRVTSGGGRSPAELTQGHGPKARIR